MMGVYYVAVTTNLLLTFLLYLLPAQRLDIQKSG